MNRIFIGLFGAIILAFLAGLALWLPVSAEEEETIPIPIPENSLIRIVANQGQWDEPVLYRAKMSGGRVYFTSQGITWDFFHLPPRPHSRKELQATYGSLAAWENQLVRGQVVHQRFLGANAAPEIVGNWKATEYHNYFLGDDPSRWAGGVPVFRRLDYRELYPGVDLRYYGVGENLKYEFHLQPGADPTQIRMEIEGAESLKLRNGSLVIETTVRTVTEQPPLAWQETPSGQKKVDCLFELDGNILSYTFPEGFDPRYPLVIDPTLVFSTYSGSTADNWGFTATYDDAGNAYAGGIEWNGGGTVLGSYPTTAGAYQMSFAGGQSDVTLSKFDPTGATLIWATYLGGTLADQPHSLVTNANEELFVLGRTQSSNYPVTTGAYDVTANGGYDLFVTHLNATATNLIGSTYIGGGADDGVNIDASAFAASTLKHNYGDDARGEIILSSNGDVLVASPSKSFNFPTTPGVVQPTFGGLQDGVIFKMDPALTTMNWSTFIGGTGQDAAYTLREDSQGNIVVGGGTNSSNFPTSANAWLPLWMGIEDGFVIKMSSNATTLLASSYVGTNFYDQIFLLDIDEDDDVYVAGQTEGNFPVFNPVAGPVYANNNSPQFILKLDGNLSAPIFSTRIGSQNATEVNISPTAFLVDVCENIYLSGWGGVTNVNGSTVGMPITTNAYQSTTDGNDIYLAVLERDAQSLLYATFLGGNDPNGFTGEHVDGGTCRFDKNGVVYHAVCAQCGTSPAFPTTAGVYSPTTGYPTNCNLAVFKMAFELTGVNAEFIPRDKNNLPLLQVGCSPLVVKFDNVTSGADSSLATYFWDFGDNTTSSAFEPTHLYGIPGTYTVTLIVTDSSTCNIADTTEGLIQVLPQPVADAGPDLIACPGDTVTLQALSQAQHYEWNPKNIIIGPDTLPTVQVTITGNTQVILTVTDSSTCEASDTAWVFLDPNFVVDIGPDTTVCLNGPFSLSAQTNDPASNFSWTTIPNLPQAVASGPNINVAGIDSTVIFVVEAESLNGCKAFDTVTVSVFRVNTSADTSICFGESVTLNAINGVSFDWSPNDGSISDPNVQNPVVNPLSNTTYTVTATSSAGCVSTASVNVEVRPLPTITITPDTAICLGDSINLSVAGGIDYQWFPATGLTNSNISSPRASPTQSTDYSVAVTGSNGCVDTGEIALTIWPLPPVDAGPDEKICANDTAFLVASGANQYQWQPIDLVTDPNSPATAAFPSDTRQFVVVGTDNRGCVNSDSLILEVIPRPVTEITGPQVVCFGDSIVLRANGGQTFLWSTGQTTSSIRISPAGPSEYYVTGFNENCPGNTDTFQVDVIYDIPVADFVVDTTQIFAPLTTTLINQSTNAVGYQWRVLGTNSTSEEINPTFTFPEAEDYVIQLISLSASGCPDTAYFTLSLENVLLFVPTAFTPNGDNSNDFFKVGYTGITGLDIQIFSRWGPVIFESSDKDFTWDGTIDGREAPEGVYIWRVVATGENGLRYVQEGTVTLLR